MALENREERRLTAEQRDRVLDIAARLQAQHQATTTVEDLAQAANEAGIDSRFVHEAVERLDIKPAPITIPWFPLGFFLAQASLFIAASNSRLESSGFRPQGLAPAFGMFPLHELLMAALASLLLTLWAGRHRSVRWLSPVAIATIWAFLGIFDSFYLNQRHVYAAWIPGLATVFGLVQAGSAVVGALLADRLDRIG